MLQGTCSYVELPHMTSTTLSCMSCQVLTHLESKLLSGKQLDKQQHLQALQECSSVPFDTVKTFLKGRKDVAKDNPEAACLLEKCKVQFGAANVSARLHRLLAAGNLQLAACSCSVELLQREEHIAHALLLWGMHYILHGMHLCLMQLTACNVNRMQHRRPWWELMQVSCWAISN